MPKKTTPPKKRDRTRKNGPPARRPSIGGKPTVRTPENELKVIEAVKVGAPWRYAAQYAGMSEDSLLEWRKADPEFSARLARAKDDAAVKLLKSIESHADADWRAALALLRIHDRESFSERFVFRGDADAPIKHDHVDATDLVAARVRANPELAAQFDRVIAEAAKPARLPNPKSHDPATGDSRS